MDTLTASAPTLAVKTFTNGFGEWRAHVEFSHTLSENDSRPEFNLGVQWPRIRRAARNAIVAEVAAREQTTGETIEDAARRVRVTLPRLAVIDQGIYASLNTWFSVTLGE